ncbi:serine/threonine-protein phosphatase 7 long form homolog [Gastrolobium bilobum]|uniref:serine/threonine-protein phosphatase 7 long form homolog n=1 Tax=Gastrolobium bilobum TaxID=150636 RepID=UPI002AB2D8D5|nr:serine/threonine-protein phosphatase 7 long form homolog [Gastrolobium bilobum]
MEHDEASRPRSPRSVIDPGPVDCTLLTLQDKHISTHVRNTCEDPNVQDRVINVRHVATHNHLDISEEIQPWLMQAGFYHIMRLRNHEIDHALVSALVERWRPETRTFHMTMGEVSITLEDVHHLLGLPTDGEVVSGRHRRHPFRQIISGFLGVNPQASRDLSGGLLGLHFLRERFQHYGGHTNPLHRVTRGTSSGQPSKSLTTL